MRPSSSSRTRPGTAAASPSASSTRVSTSHNPALQTTTTGERKIVDWVTMTDPTFTGTTNNDDDPTWILIGTPRSPADLHRGAATYTAPGRRLPLRYVQRARPPARRRGRQRRQPRRQPGRLAAGSSPSLWDTATNRVWVDANQNDSFADEPAHDRLQDQPGRRLLRHRQPGHADPRVACRSSCRPTGRTTVVNIGIVSGDHGSHVSGIVAANSLFGGADRRRRPGRQARRRSGSASSSRAAPTTPCIEGMIYAARAANVDVINMSIGGLPALNDGNNARAELYNQLIDAYGVQMFISAGNSGAGLNTIGDPAVATKVVAVGSYITKATWQSQLRLRRAGHRQHAPVLVARSARGRRLQAAASSRPARPSRPCPTWQPGQPVAGTYTLPPGYAMLNGTSMASPQAAGAGALLRQRREGDERGPVTPAAAAHRRCCSTARFLATATRRLRAGQRPDRRRQGVGPAEAATP